MYVRLFLLSYWKILPSPVVCLAGSVNGYAVQTIAGESVYAGEWSHGAKRGFGVLSSTVDGVEKIQAGIWGEDGFESADEETAQKKADEAHKKAKEAETIVAKVPFVLVSILYVFL